MKKDLLGTVWQKLSSNQTSYTPMGIPKSPTKSVLKSSLVKDEAGHIPKTPSPPPKTLKDLHDKASHFCGSVPHLLVPTPKGWKDNVLHLMAMSKSAKTHRAGGS